MNNAVVDSSAILAHLKDEAGGERLDDPSWAWAVSTVNLAEILTKLTDHTGDFARASVLLSAIPLVIHDFDQALAEACAALRPVTRHRGLSLGDRACIALAQRENLPVLTADRAWADLDLGVEVVLIR